MIKFSMIFFAMAVIIRSFCCSATSNTQMPDEAPGFSKKEISFDFALAAIVVLTGTLITIAAAQGFGVVYFSGWGTISMYAVGSTLVVFSIGLVVADSFICCKKTIDKEPDISEEVSVSVSKTKEDSDPSEALSEHESSEKTASSIEEIQETSPLSDEEKAAIKIQRAWKAQRYRFKEKDLQGTAGLWIMLYFKNFIAHDVHPIYGKNILETGVVKPPEMMFRETFAIQYVYAGIHSVDFSRLDVEIIKKINALPLYYRFDTPNKKYPFEYDATTFLEEREEYRKISRTLDDDQRELAVEKLKKLEPPSIICEEDAFYEQRKEICKMDERLKKNKKMLKIMKDQLLPDNRRLDVLLSHHFKNLGDIGESFREATEICGKARYDVLENRTIDYEIRGTKNCVSWYSAEITVLNTSKNRIVGYEEGSRVRLLAPFHNDGQFFTLNLNDRDNFLLGSRSKLEAYNGKYLVLYIEDLTPRQANFFSIPHRMDNEYARKLELSKSPLVSKDYNPLRYLNERNREWTIT